MPSFEATHVDGEIAAIRPVTVTVPPPSPHARLEIALSANGDAVDSWPIEGLFSVPAARGTLRIGVRGRPYGARLAFAGDDTVKQVRALLPVLAARQGIRRGRQLMTIGIATLALASAILAYVYGVPMVASNIVAMVPAEWESQLGETVAAQVGTALGGEDGLELCDPNPNSLANRAITRFANSVVAGSGSHFVPQVSVVRSSVPNAFALPGGRSYYFSALLEKTETADEFAGVLAHELGHVVHRHGMETLVATSATGLLIGFVMGDMTGMSVAGGVGAALIDNRFSRETEREADRFALDASRRLGFSAAGLGIILTRLEGDRTMSAAASLLSSHPLTAERRLMLTTIDGPDAGLSPAFTAVEWRAIKAMCGAGGRAAEPAAAAVATPPADIAPPSRPDRASSP